MNPIYINSLDEDHSFQSFYDRLIDICNSHIRDNRAFCFCLFLYDETNASFIKAVTDKVYWDALHHTSGDLLTIFSIHKKHRGRMRANSSPYQTMRIQLHSHKVYSKEELPKENQKLIEKFFKDVADINYPSLLFFQIDDEKISDHLIVELREKKAEETYLELKEIIDAAVTGLKRLDRANKENRQGAFDQVVGELTKMQNKYTLIRLAKKFVSAKEFIDSFKD
ncbi:MAG: hypothetical protein J0L69_07645 [Bacteroidetes bacterium]|nr:hypothetical protein [Bacteroidota bacterium]